jgi:hypothetical protein
LYFVFIISLFLATSLQNTIQHEDVHQANCEAIGGNVTDYEAGIFSGHVNCSINYNISEEMKAAYFMADSYNEAITYNNQAITQLLFGIFSLLVLLLLRISLR